MAGDWIKMRGNLWDDPRVGRLCDLSGAGEAAVIGALYWLWATADQHTQNGTMPGLSLRQIDRKTGVPGFAAALVDIGWLIDDPAGVIIVKFEEHNGSSAKRRCTNAQNKALNRSLSASDADIGGTEGGQDDDELRRIAELEKEKRESKGTPNGVPGEDPPGSVAVAVELDEGLPPCPHQAIIEAFHRALPTARQIRDWTPARATALRTRWREKKKRQRVEWWAEFFAYCARSKFLTGRAPTESGRKPFELSLDWVVKAENFANIVEGKYHHDADPAPDEVAV